MPVRPLISLDRSGRMRDDAASGCPGTIAPSRRPEPMLPLARRRFLTDAGGGFGAVACTAMLALDRVGPASTTKPAVPRPHFTPRAQRVIYLFMLVGPSHVDLFDP